jgi:hypothetical protein
LERNAQNACSSGISPIGGFYGVTPARLDSMTPPGIMPRRASRQGNRETAETNPAEVRGITGAMARRAPGMDLPWWTAAQPDQAYAPLLRVSGA